MTIKTAKDGKLKAANVVARTSTLRKSIWKTKKRRMQCRRALTIGLRRKRQLDWQLSASRKRKKKRCEDSYLSSNSARRLRNWLRNSACKKKLADKKSERTKSTRTALLAKLPRSRNVCGLMMRNASDSMS